VARVIAVANQKGGVGKTTTSVNLAASLALTGCRTLLIDLDPQGNASMGLGVNKESSHPTMYDWLMPRVSFESVVQKCVAGVWLVPGNTDLTAAEVELLSEDQRERRLQQILAPVVNDFEYVIIDCPPSLNILTLNALVASHGVLVPMQCEYYALEGLSALLDTIDGVRQHANADLEIEGLLRTMYDPRNALTREVSRQLFLHFSEKVFRTVIPRNVRLAEAPSHGLPAILYDRQSRGAVAYMALAGEIKRKYSESRYAKLATARS
jgi:chromosome partitioning protein